MSAWVDGGPERTPDGRWLVVVVVGGRRWRAADPALPEDDTTPAAARAWVRTAKRGLGERGPAWWDEEPEARRARCEAALTTLDGG